TYEQLEEEEELSYDKQLKEEEELKEELSYDEQLEEEEELVIKNNLKKGVEL
ncbi:4707_t:CDS:2, partial [Funneliformis caledonium]